jgi:hypothetical protein
MASEPPDDSTLREPGQLSRELIALIRAVADADATREARIEERLAELGAHLEESRRLQQLITGGTSRREARLRALEDRVEALAAENPRAIPPRPLEIPRSRDGEVAALDKLAARLTEIGDD